MSPRTFESGCSVVSSLTGDGEAKPACTAHQGDVDLGTWGHHLKSASRKGCEAKKSALYDANWWWASSVENPNNDVDEDNA